MKQELKNEILKQKYLYRGTNDFCFKQRQKEGFYYGYFERTRNGLIYSTSTSIYLNIAMICGVDRLKQDYSEPYYNAKPILLAIDAQKCANQMDIGLESNEIEIRGKIDFKNIIVIDSLEKLLEICPCAKRYEINGFKEDYLPTFQHDTKK